MIYEYFVATEFCCTLLLRIGVKMSISYLRNQSNRNRVFLVYVTDAVRPS